MNISMLQQDDVHSFWRLRLQALRNQPRAFGSSYEDAKDIPIEVVRERLISADNNFVVGAFTEAEVLVGMVGFKQEPSKKMSHKGLVWGMYVDEQYQGRGIGKLLITEMLTMVYKLQEIEQINLMVVVDNIAAKRLYESAGFITYGTEINAMKLDEDTYVDDELMVKRLER
jgi:ribosomal protein S18 acetylase RimI-like enzyme